jgi:hypothetical protein|tara:strand:- start:53 stop:388 length:336 start_codon:yes stop_codon:yes gene_type:complete
MINQQKKNKLKTPGYFIKRLKDNDFVTLRIFDKYSESDPRKWTVLVDPKGSSVYITCFENTPFKGEYLFQFNDGNQLFKNSFSLKTDSIEVVVQKLLKSGVRQKNESKFIE